MKKNLTALLLALAMTFSLAACGGNTPAEDETDAPVVEENQPAVEPEVEVEGEDVVTELPEADPEADTPAAPAEDPEVAPSMPTVNPDAPVENTPEAKPETPEVKPEENTPSAPAADSVDLNAFYEGVAAAQGENWPFMMLAEGEMLDGFFPGLTAIATKQCYAYLPAMSAVAAEFVLVEVENASDIEAVKAILQARIDTQVDGGAWYPETIEGWKTNSRIVTNGNCIMLAVFSDVDAIVSEFNGLFA